MEYVLTEETQRLVEANIGLVKFAINKYICIPEYSFPDIDYDDLVSIGYIGLCKAAVRYAPESKSTFSTYATLAIVRAIKREFLGRYRNKRGKGIISVSYDAPTKDGKDALQILRTVHDTISVEKEVIDRIAYTPIWEYVPTYCAIQRSGLTDKEYAELIGMPKSTVNTKKRREFKKAIKAMQVFELLEGESA